MRITRKMLEARGACAAQVAIFAVEWPRGMTVTTEACERAAALRLDLNWAARYLLPAPTWAAYRAATAPVEAARASADAAYQAAYRAALASALDAYRAATASAWDAYQAAYQAATAPAFFAAVQTIRRWRRA